jgi:hypothetical protein
MRVRFDAGDVAVLTLNKSVAYLTEFGRMFGTKKLASAQRNDLSEFVAAHPNWRSGWTKNDAIDQVITCFKWANEEELIVRLPYRRPRMR